MDRKVLLAVDGSVHAIGAVHYAAQMAAVIPELRIVLTCVQPALSRYLTDEARRKPQARKALEKVMRKNKARADEVLDQATRRMVHKGVEAGHIERMTMPGDSGVANDLLAAGQAKSFDAVVVGRRGASYLRDWVIGSVTANLVEHTKVIPVWVVDGEVGSTQVLLAADGSASSLRALDHMGFMLGGDNPRRLHVLHVRPRFRDYCKIELAQEAVRQAEEVLLDDDRRCLGDFHAKARSVMERNGIDPDRLELQTIDGSLSVTRSIVQYARDNHFGTIALGLRGRSGNPFTGSVSHGILHKASDAALWMVP